MCRHDRGMPMITLAQSPVREFGNTEEARILGIGLGVYFYHTSHEDYKGMLFLVTPTAISDVCGLHRVVKASHQARFL